MNDSSNSHDRAHRGTWKELRVSLDVAVERLPQALQIEGFGVITQIDLQQTFQAKLGVGFRRYRIFGACNPAFALKAPEPAAPAPSRTIQFPVRISAPALQCSKGQRAYARARHASLSTRPRRARTWASSSSRSVTCSTDRPSASAQSAVETNRSSPPSPWAEA